MRVGAQFVVPTLNQRSKVRVLDGPPTESVTSGVFAYDNNIACLTRNVLLRIGKTVDERRYHHLPEVTRG